MPAYLSNGVIGLRVPPVPFQGGIAIVSGFEGLDPAERIETFARAPYPLAADISINGVGLNSSWPKGAELTEQRYDFATGELSTRFSYTCDGVRADLDVVTFCSRSHPTLVLQEIRLRLDRAGEVTLSAGIDPTGVTGEWAEREYDGSSPAAHGTDGLLRWRSYGGLGACGASYVTRFEGTDDVQRAFERSQIAPLRTTYRFKGRSRRTYRLRQITSLLPDTMHNQPHMQACRLVQDADRRGFDTLRELNAQAWQELWRGRVVLDGAPSRWQAMADAAFYYLHASVHSSSPASTSIFGLAYWPNYHYFRGHVMWDIEAFAVPALSLTYPDAARGLLRYRAQHLPAAQQNAAMNGFAGAQYPWESAVKSGEEATPGSGHAPTVEHHVSQDIAIALARHVHATGDMNFAREHAWPVLSNVADWVVSRAERTERGFEIKRVNGIAEAEQPRDNNAFVNAASIIALREAIGLSQRLDLPVGHRWDEVASGLVIPMDESGTTILNYDGYQPEDDKGETPEAAATLFPLEFAVEPDIASKTYKYYLDLADRYAGSPMLSALLGVFAARSGDRTLALELFERGYADFVTDPYRITLEYAPDVFPDQPRAGPFTANLSGFLTGCLYGLTGLVLDSGEPGQWCRHPVLLPSGWDAVRVDRIWVRQEPAALLARHGDERAELIR
jgi:protein-glucosylgalactosylhydroxylysine glucosidase